MRMRPSLVVRTLIVTLALEWELCGEDPVVFCYRMSVNLRAPCSLDSPSADDGVMSSGCGCGLQGQGCGPEVQPATNRNDRIASALTSLPLQR